MQKLSRKKKETVVIMDEEEEVGGTSRPRQVSRPHIDLRIEVARLVQEIIQTANSSSIAPGANLYQFCADLLEAKLRQRERSEKVCIERKRQSRQRKIQPVMQDESSKTVTTQAESVSRLSRAEDLSGVATGVSCGMRRVEADNEHINKTPQGCTPLAVKDLPRCDDFFIEPPQRDNVCLHTLEGHTRPVTSCLLFRGFVITSSTDSTVKLWSLKTGEFLLELECGQPVYSITALQINSDSFVILSACDDGNVPTWIIDTSGKVKAICTNLLPCHAPNPIRALATSPDGRYMASGCCFYMYQISRDSPHALSIRGTLKTWLLPHVLECATNPDKCQLRHVGLKTMRQLASFFDPVKVKDSMQSPQDKYQLQSDIQLGIRALAYTNDSSKLLVGFGSPVDEVECHPKKVLLCCAVSLQSLWVLESVTTHINGLLHTNSAASHDESYDVMLSSQRHMEKVTILHTGLKASNKGTYRTVVLWSQKFSGPHSGVWRCTSDTVASATGSVLRIWDMAKGDEVAIYDGHKDTIISACIDNNYICTGSLDATAKIWHAPKHRSRQYAEKKMSQKLSLERSKLVL